MSLIAEPRPVAALPVSRLASSGADKRLANLDLLRGVAALLVCAGHLRAFLFVDFAHVTTPNILTRAFYFLTGLGHQAVVIFFVLSGYLVGGSVLTAYQNGRWSWAKYASRRMTRLWVVLLPALILTYALDTIGRHWAHTGYAGELRALYNSGPTIETPADLRLTTFLGNTFFLQTIRVNCFGTNGPLWSLANEFWYYLLFPLLCSVVFAFRRPCRAEAAAKADCRAEAAAKADGSTSSPLSRCLTAIFCFLLFAYLWWYLPAAILWSGLIWLMGVAAFWVAQNGSARAIFSHPIILIITTLLVLVTLTASKTKSPVGNDFGIGVAVAIWVIGLVSREHGVNWLKKVSCGMSEMSYTLYLVHFPILALIFFCFFAGKQLQPGMVALCEFGALLALSIVCSASMWWCFERNTDSIRKQLDAIIFRRFYAQN